MRLTFLFIFLVLIACSPPSDSASSCCENEEVVTEYLYELIILGNVQDAGSPHAGCQKDCCRELFESPDKNRAVVSLGIIDRKSQKTYLIEATPDISRQMKILSRKAGFENKEVPDAIFLTHAHIGHYAGLMYLGREALNADRVPVYAMPRMSQFLGSNGPWDQLVRLNNIELRELQPNTALQAGHLHFEAIQVPHRDEYSETVGFIISGPHKKALFIPDIDKWEKWDLSIVDILKTVDYAFLDGTFYDAEEINHRDISEIPHPFVIESMKAFGDLNKTERAKIHFIHFNHTNPLLRSESPQTKKVLSEGYSIARMHDVFDL